MKVGQLQDVEESMLDHTADLVEMMSVAAKLPYDELRGNLETMRTQGQEINAPDGTSTSGKEPEM